MRTLPARITFTLTAALLATAGNSFAIDTQLLNLVMPDAQVMAGINVTNSEFSPLGTFLMSQISANDQSLQKLITQTGFDPRRDVSEVLIASNGSATAPSFIALSKGTFDVAKLSAAVGSAQQVSLYKGATLITGGDANSGAVAFIGGNIAIAGNLASVKAAVDQSGGSGSATTPLTTQAQALSATQDAWSVSLASLSALIPGMGGSAAPGPNGMASQAFQLVKNIQSCSAGLKFGANVQFTAQAVADTEQDAGALRDVIKMVASLASMGAGGSKDGAAIAQLFQALQVSSTGATVNLSATVPEAQIEALLNATMMPKAAAKVRKM